MSRLLLVSASPRGEASESRRLSAALLDGHAAAGGGPVDRLDLFADPLPPFAAREATAKMAVIGGSVPTGVDAAAWERVLALGARVAAADALVLAAPMWNSGIPWALKLFVDTVTQPGVAFRFDPERGYVGLLGGRRAAVLATSHVYAPGVPAAFGVDHHVAYLEQWLTMCGFGPVDVVRLQPSRPGSPGLEQRRERALAEARAVGRALAAVPAVAR
ncbi:FMN-dependent NADH-azoreductase [Patulibacter defluvii]|uniref:FMN-dependent NADH-azoreductase n=1 Tax=Patulibacter defluvii TaxID=3095358 RepID=UPI002A753C38|nr:NAD(P)H-dependent oxidoreductase [Patulibacter sp. DM4]